MKISKGTRSTGRTKKYMHSNCPTWLNIWIKPFKIESISLVGWKAIHRHPGRICTVTPESHSFKLSHLRCLDNRVPWVLLFCSVCISTTAKEKLNTQRIKICCFFTNTREHGKCLKVRMPCLCLYSLWAISMAVDIQYWVSYKAQSTIKSPKKAGEYPGFNYHHIRFLNADESKCQTKRTACNTAHFRDCLFTRLMSAQQTDYMQELKRSNILKKNGAINLYGSQTTWT